MSFFSFLRLIGLLGGLGLLLGLSSCSLLTSGLQVAGAVDGQVVDLRTREPIARAEVRSERVGKSRKTKTRRDGSFRLRPLLTYTKDPSLYSAVENHYVRVSAEGYEPTSLSFRHPLEEGARPPARRNLTISLRRKGEGFTAGIPAPPPLSFSDVGEEPRPSRGGRPDFSPSFQGEITPPSAPSYPKIPSVP